MNKVLCKENSHGLTKGKWYPVSGSYFAKDGLHYKIIDDYGDKCWYNKSLFKTQPEVREEKLIELDI